MKTDPHSYDLLALDEIIESYDYETDPVLQEQFRPVEDALWTLIEHYAEGVNDFGFEMAQHLQRTSNDGMHFLIDELGFSQKAGRNFYAANLFQDLGKIHPAYDPHIWNLPHRPTDEERAEKKKHVWRGVEMLEIALADASPELKLHPHVKTVIPAIQLFHHERCDGNGPFGITSDKIGQVIKTVCIVDTKDGDMIQRGHQNEIRDEPTALCRMKSLEAFDDKGKYAGAFDSMLDRYIAYRERISGQEILSNEDRV